MDVPSEKQMAVVRELASQLAGIEATMKRIVALAPKLPTADSLQGLKDLASSISWAFESVADTSSKIPDRQSLLPLVNTADKLAASVKAAAENLRELKGG